LDAGQHREARGARSGSAAALPILGGDYRLAEPLILFAEPLGLALLRGSPQRPLCRAFRRSRERAEAVFARSSRGTGGSMWAAAGLSAGEPRSAPGPGSYETRPEVKPGRPRFDLDGSDFPYALVGRLVRFIPCQAASKLAPTPRAEACFSPPWSVATGPDIAMSHAPPCRSIESRNPSLNSRRMISINCRSASVNSIAVVVMAGPCSSVSARSCSTSRASVRITS